MSTVGNAETFKQGFLDEAREILVELEAALLALNEDHADSDHVGRVFRALHTIKGSGSMFGFDKLAAFTHDLETAFDEVRIGRILKSKGWIRYRETADEKGHRSWGYRRSPNQARESQSQ